MENEEKSRPRFGKIIAIGLICFALFIGFANWIPSRIFLRPKSFCSQAEFDADKIAAAISDYYSVPQHGPVVPGDIEPRDLEVQVDNPWTMTTCGDLVFIHVIDRSGICPAEYQSQDPGWNSNIYTLKF